MPGSTPARLLAPLALVLTALALLIVVTSGGDDSSSSSGTGTTAEPTATETRTPRPTREPTETPSGDSTTYTVQSGDSPSSIAEQEGVSVDALLEANPDVDPNALSVGDELEIPQG